MFQLSYSVIIETAIRAACYIVVSISLYYEGDDKPGVGLTASSCSKTEAAAVQVTNFSDLEYVGNSRGHTSSGVRLIIISNRLLGLLGRRMNMVWAAAESSRVSAN